MAALLMREAARGGQKRPPLDAVRVEPGRYRIVDGNSTLSALPFMGEGKVPVRVVKPRSEAKSAEELATKAREALPALEEWTRGVASQAREAGISRRPCVWRATRLAFRR